MEKVPIRGLERQSNAYNVQVEHATWGSKRYKHSHRHKYFNSGKTVLQKDGAKHDLNTSISCEHFPGLELSEAVKWSGKEHRVRDRWGISAGRAFKPRSRRQRANKFLYHIDQPTYFLLYVPFFSDRAALPFTSYLHLPSYPARIQSAGVEIGQPHKWNKVVESTGEKAGVSGISTEPHSPVLWEKLRTEACKPWTSTAHQLDQVTAQREDQGANEFPGVVAFPLK